MLKNTVFVILLIVSLLLMFAVGDARSEMPDNTIASCTVKSNDFAFLCLLNTKNHNSCKFMIGTSFVLPKCKPCGDKPSTVVKPTAKPASKPNDIWGDFLNNRNY